MTTVAVTLGDAAGIGPEIVVKAFANPAINPVCSAFVVGHAATLERAAKRYAPGLQVRRITHAAQHRAAAGVVDVLDVGDLPDDLPMGQVSALAGQAAYAAIDCAIGMALRGEVAAICTAPIHKEALAAAGVPYPGHTEMLAERTGSTDTAMMLVNPQLRTILVTVHCAMRQAIELLTVERELRIILLAHRSLQAMGIAQPRIAVAGLNPHAGEGGLFGSEDLQVIAPAIAQARAMGVDASGPHPGDTVFMQARRGRYDIVVAQYHDQGLIPIKLLGVEDGVNVTAGLPFVRTSPDHGTAFDIAGQGIADASSLKTALRAAVQLSQGPAAR
jgi:4-hydroxythreonine-4-phosphate dehydrogenase